MALKDILVHLDATPRSKVRLEIAARLATQCGAHLTGVHVIDIPSANYFYGAAMPFVPTNPEEIVERMRADATEAAGPIEAAFRDCLAPQRPAGRMAAGGGHPGGHGGAARPLCGPDSGRPAQLV